MTTETRGLVARSPPGRISIVRVCIVYDCLYPYTIGGAERWYRNLAERLAEAGHEVTFLTRRQWPRGAHADVAGVRVVTVSPAMELYAGGRRRDLPPGLLRARGLCHPRPPPQPL